MRGEMHGHGYRHWASHVAAALAGTTAAVPLDDRTAYLEYPLVRLPAREGARRLHLTDEAPLVGLEEQTGATIHLPWQDGQRLCDANDDDHSYRVAIVNAPDVRDCARLAESLPHCLHGLPQDRRPGACVPSAEVSVA